MQGEQQTQAPRPPTVWRAFWPERVLATCCVWVLLPLASTGAVINALSGAAHWGEALGTAAVAAGAAFVGRIWIVEAAVDGQVLRMRRLLFGRAETLLIGRVRSARYCVSFSSALPNYITLRMATLAFAVLRGYVYPRAQREAWAALVADLRQALGDRWHE